MRKTGPPSEVRRLARPIFVAIDAAWQRMHWWIAAMIVIYVFSGITILRSDEVAVILRWGRLVGDTPALQEHGPGLLFAFPKPIDQVVRVQVKHVWELPIDVLNSAGGYYQEQGLDPVSQGYAVTGDHNIVHVQVVARYRVRDTAEWAFYGPKAEDVLRVELTAAMVRSLGEMGVDRVLADGRKDLIATATRHAQAGLDAAHSGLELSSLELTRLAPPAALAGAFDAVQSAFIGAQTKKNQAQAFAQSAIPQAQAEADAAIQSAHGDAESVLAIAKGESKAFLALAREYHANPTVVRERLYRNALDRSIATAGDVRWVPPPSGSSYHGFRITLKPSPKSDDAEGEGTSDSINMGAPPPGSMEGDTE
ncbi:MAG: protease modulator HflK [Oligoflexia bacterium]|nr:protease modulator HflK [Oligoflexia bacterium]